MCGPHPTTKSPKPSAAAHTTNLAPRQTGIAAQSTTGSAHTEPAITAANDTTTKHAIVVGAACVPAFGAMPDAPDAKVSSPAKIRKAGLINVGVGLGGIVLARLLVEVLIAMDSASPMISGTLAVLFPVVAAFGLTSAITGRDTGWFRIPLVVVFSLVLIAFAFYVIIPSGYRLSRS